MYLVFYKTNDVFLAEEKLNEQEICVKIVPTPVQDKAYCGVCIQVNKEDIAKINSILNDMEYVKIEKG